MEIFPPLEHMWTVYPRGSAARVKARIGGNVNADWIQNTCAIRMSHVLNECGHAIPRNLSYLNTVRGANGKRFAFRLTELREYLERTYGEPLSWGGVSPFGTALKPAGVILFLECNFSGASGHIDLYNGRECAGTAYFDDAGDVRWWPCGIDTDA